MKQSSTNSKFASDRPIGWHLLISTNRDQTVALHGFPSQLKDNWLRARGERLVSVDADLLVEYGNCIQVTPGKKHPVAHSDTRFRFEATRTYGLIPPNNPRLVLPLEHRAQLIRGLTMHRPGRPSARLAMLVLRCLAALGITAPLKRRKLVIHAGSPASTVIDPDSVLYLGTEDPDRKTTILTSDICEIAKHGTGVLSEAALLREVNALTSLQDTIVAAQVPKLLSFNPMNNGKLLFQEYRRPLWATRRWVKNEAVQFLSRLSNINASTRDGIPGHRCHGDFAPWNMIRSDNGLFVFDWEKSRDWAPALTDAFYFVLAPTLHVQSREQLADAVRRAIRFGCRVARATDVNEDLVPTLWQLWVNSQNNHSLSETFKKIEDIEVLHGD